MPHTLTPDRVLDCVPLGDEEVPFARLQQAVDELSIPINERGTVNVSPLLSGPLLVGVAAIDLCAELSGKSVEEVIFDLRARLATG